MLEAKANYSKEQERFFRTAVLNYLSNSNIKEWPKSEWFWFDDKFDIEIWTDELTDQKIITIYKPDVDPDYLFGYSINMSLS